MSFRCHDCQKTVRTIADVRNCPRCQSKGTAQSIPSHQSDSDWLTPAIIGYALGGGFSSHHETPSAPAYEGAGGSFGGGGSSGSWDSGSSSSSDSGSSSSSSDSSSSDSGSSSSDSGGSSGGGSD